MKLNLPIYVVARARKGRVVFYFKVPPNRRPDGWPPCIPLPDDLQQAFREGESLYKRLVAHRGGTAVVTLQRGSLPLIVREYQHSRDYRELAPVTQRSYEQLIGHILDWSKRAGHPHIRFLTRPVVLEFLKLFEERPTLRKKIGGMIRILCQRAIDAGEITVNPATALRLKENRKPPHIFTQDEIMRLVATCAAENQPEMARAVITGWSIGQREGDILSLQIPRDYQDGHFIVRQSKTGELLRIPAPRDLRPWLDATPAGPLIGKDWKEDNFRHWFAYLRGKAGLPATAKFMHLRHSAAVRLARAGNTVPEIAAVTGHSIHSTQSILDRYLPRDPVVAQNAIRKLNNYDKKMRVTTPQPVEKSHAAKA